jgi:hypothetical protein
VGDTALSSEAGHAPLKPGQCLVYTPGSLLDIASELWLDHVYIAQRQNAKKLTSVQAMLSVSRFGSLWATDVTVEGDGVSSQFGVRVSQDGKAFFTGTRRAPAATCWNRAARTSLTHLPALAPPRCQIWAWHGGSMHHMSTLALTDPRFSLPRSCQREVALLAHHTHACSCRRRGVGGPAACAERQAAGRRWCGEDRLFWCGVHTATSDGVLTATTGVVCRQPLPAPGPRRAGDRNVGELVATCSDV